MKKTISLNNFRDEFKSCRPDNFTYDGLEALFNYLESFESDTGEELELDVIAICCDFSEYKNLEEFQADYGQDYETMEDIEQSTTFIPINKESFIIQNF